MDEEEQGSHVVAACEIDKSRIERSSLLALDFSRKPSLQFNLQLTSGSVRVLAFGTLENNEINFLKYILSLSSGTLS